MIPSAHTFTHIKTSIESSQKMHVNPRYVLFFFFNPPSLPNISHVYAPTERLQGCMLSVIHQHRPPARTGSGQGSGPSCQIHHMQIKQAPLPSSAVWKQTLKIQISRCLDDLKHIFTYISIFAIMHTHQHKVWFVLSSVASLVLFLNMNQQPLPHALRLFLRQKHTHSHMHPLSFKGMPALSFKMQGEDIQRETGMLAFTHSQGHTQPCCCTPVKQHRRNKRDALPFLPLVLHPALFSFPSRVHTVSEEGIHSWEERRRRRRRSKRVRKWRREGGREGGASRKRAGGEGGGVQLVRVDGRGVRFRALPLLPLIRRRAR